MSTMEFSPKQESKKVSEYGHDILNLETTEIEQLRNRIEKWRGLVRMFVHPMYEKWRWGNEYPGHPHKENLHQIEEVLAKLLAMPEEKTPPMIIMEESKYIANLQEWLKENPQGVSQNEVYFVGTNPNDPTPKLENKNGKEAWDVFVEKLTELGVKKILMGGMQLEVSSLKKDWTNKDPFLARCVGIAMSHLSKDKAGKFEVELSALTEPRSEREYFISLKKKG